MKKIIILITFLLITTVNVSSEEKEALPDNCFDKYKFSPSTLACQIRKGSKRLVTNKDGSINTLGKIFYSKTQKELLSK